MKTCFLLLAIALSCPGLLLAAEPDDLKLTEANGAIIQGRSFLVNQKFREAETEFLTALNIRLAALGTDHPETLDARKILASTLVRHERHAEAEAQYREIRQVYERTQGAEHLDTLGARYYIASALLAQRKHREAEAEHRAVLAIAERGVARRLVFPEHPIVWGSRLGIADALDGQGKHGEAEAEHRAVLAYNERIEDHEPRRESLYRLAVNLKAQRKTREALQFARRAADDWRRTFGADYFLTKKAERLVHDLELSDR